MTTILSLILEFNKGTIKGETTFLQKLCVHFELGDEQVIAYLKKHSKNKKTGDDFAYAVMLNKEKYAIQSKNVRPLQFVLGRIPTMNAFTDNRGKDWNKARQLKYFKSVANNEL